MALPVSTKVTIPNPRLINPSSYKASMDVNIPGLGRSMSDLVCGAVFNTLAIKANNNPLRTFTYNLMAKEDYKGEAFKDLCEYSGSYAVVQYLKSKHQSIPSTEDEDLRNITESIKSKVPEAITLWMSSLFGKFPDLEFNIGSSLAYKSKSLHSRYLNSKQEIKNMFSNNQQQQFLQQLLASQGQQNPMNAMMNQMNLATDPVVNFNIRGMSIQMPQSKALQLKQILETNPAQAVQILANNGLPHVAQHLANQLQQQQFQMNQGFNNQNQGFFNNGSTSGFNINGVMNNVPQEKPNLSGFHNVDNNQMTQSNRDTGTQSNLYKQWLIDNGRSHEIDSVEIGAPQKNPIDSHKGTQVGDIYSVSLEPEDVVIQDVKKEIDPDEVKKKRDALFALLSDKSVNLNNRKNSQPVRVVTEYTADGKKIQYEIRKRVKTHVEAKKEKLYDPEVEDYPLDVAEDPKLIFSKLKTDEIDTTTAVIKEEISDDPDVANIYDSVVKSKYDFTGVTDYIKRIVKASTDIKNPELISNDEGVRKCVDAVINLETLLTETTNKTLRNILKSPITVDSALLDYTELKKILFDQFGDEAIGLLDSELKYTLDRISHGTDKEIASMKEDVGFINVPYSELELGIHYKGLPVTFADKDMEILMEFINALDWELEIDISKYYLRFKSGYIYSLRKIRTDAEGCDYYLFEKI